MRKDIRDTSLYREAESFYKSWRLPGTGQISDAGELHASSDGRRAVFAGTLVDTLEGGSPTRICDIDLTSGRTRVLTFGPHTDRLPKYSPDGRSVAFLSDRRKGGDFQLYLLDLQSGAARATPPVEGWVEYLHWSPDGRRVLLAVAGHGADISGGQGAITSQRIATGSPGWMPAIETKDVSHGWRRAWVYELATDSVRQISRMEINIWETVWCGNDAIAAVVSPGPGEGLWYSARLQIVTVATGEGRDIYSPKDQLGWPAACASGQLLAVVEAVCSDRWIVAGDLHLIDVDSGRVRQVDTGGIDITYTEWRSERQLLLAGHRGFETVVALYDASSGAFSEVWSSTELTTGGRYAAVSGVGEKGDCMLVGESFVRSPEIAVIHNRKYRCVKALHALNDETEGVPSVRTVTWRAPDGLEMQGWLLLPQGTGPFPLVMNLHGGPVSHWRQTWLGRRSASIPMLLNRGYAIFFPNPRGSVGRGREFARLVLGDMGGADTYDCLSGIDELVGRGIADPGRLGVTGVSYGGFMTAWLITQDGRFAAAVAVAPVINQVTEHLLSNIPHFVSLFLADTYTNPTGKYFQRSPVMHAHKTRTPTLNVCGALDRCTPPQEAQQFHNALLENGVESVLLAYPQEGHGIRKLPAAMDYAARTVAWFEEHMPVAGR